MHTCNLLISHIYTYISHILIPKPPEKEKTSGMRPRDSKTALPEHLFPLPLAQCFEIGFQLRPKALLLPSTPKSNSTLHQLDVFDP